MVCGLRLPASRLSRARLLLLGCWGLFTPAIVSLEIAPPSAFPSSRLAQISGFSTWRPYSNQNRLVSVGMNKAEVISIAGKPDFEESYYQSAGRRLTRISDWYYTQSGIDAQTTILKFAEERLVSITTNLTR